ncbi:MAG: hypothetical protein WAX07_04220 [Candidatus Altiarchaeia archaeon]
MRLFYVLPTVFFMFFLVLLLLVLQNKINYAGTGADTSGWSAIHPMARTAVYGREGDFSASFNSRIEDPIKITSVNVSVSGEYPCVVEPDLAGVNVPAFGSFDLKATCPRKTGGETYSILITIKYMPYDDNAPDEVAEEGRIFGHTR